VQRWFRDATPAARLAGDTGISTATAYRYLHESNIQHRARRPGAPNLHDVLTRRLAAGDTHFVPGRHRDPHHPRRWEGHQTKGP
jgi:hypothetical protein